MPHSVYLVDDHPLVKEWLCNLIQQQADLTVCGQADTATSAKDEIRKLRPDLVVVDLSLKGESGLELIKELQSLESPPGVLVLSMHDEVFYVERALRAGALGYVTKRESTTKVIEALREVRRGNVYVSESMALKMAERIVGNRLRPGASPGDVLSDRELEVFQFLGQGFDNRRIAERLNLSLKTVQSYCARIKEKLRIENATELARQAVRWVEREGAV